jgi:hypothetical protein
MRAGLRLGHGPLENCGALDFARNRLGLSLCG